MHQDSPEGGSSYLLSCLPELASQAKRLDAQRAKTHGNHLPPYNNRQHASNPTTCMHSRRGEEPHEPRYRGRMVMARARTSIYSSTPTRSYGSVVSSTLSTEPKKSVTGIWQKRWKARGAAQRRAGIGGVGHTLAATILYCA